MRTRIEKRYVYMGAILSAPLKVKLDAMSQKDRDELLRTTVRQVLGSGNVHLAKLGPTSFTLTGDEKFGERMNSKKDILEEEVNNGLLKATA
jgi:hypothetical protein